MNLIDTHFHLDAYKNYGEIFNEINEMQQYTLCVTNSPDIYEACITAIGETRFVKFGLGINPQCLKNVNFSLNKFNEMFCKSKYIGEIGLDFSKKYYETKNKQLYVFDKIAEKCSNNNKILSIHSYCAEKYVLETIKKYNIGSKCILHWYNGDISLIKKFIDLGCYFSINLNQTKCLDFKERLSAIGKDRILIETDAPIGSYNQGTYNPKNLKNIYNDIQKFCLFNLTKQVYNNFKTLLTDC